MKHLLVSLVGLLGASAFAHAGTTLSHGSISEAALKLPQVSCEATGIPSFQLEVSLSPYYDPKTQKVSCDFPTFIARKVLKVEQTGQSIVTVSIFGPECTSQYNGGVSTKDKNSYPVMATLEISDGKSAGGRADSYFNYRTGENFSISASADGPVNHAVGDDHQQPAGDTETKIYSGLRCKIL